MSNGPSWQSTAIAVVFILLVGAIFLVVYDRDGIDTAIKAWGVIGTLVGVVTGAIPTYFFGKSTIDAERKERLRAEADVRAVMSMVPPQVMAKIRQTYPQLWYRP